ncbi:MAG: DegV family protein [Peptococcaceae bacterium]|nr:DegV family protein [Peptococcaceae bacterium]
MKKICLVTDSTADLTPAQAKELKVKVQPLYVIFGEKMYRDGLEIDSDTFYTKLKASSVMPTTSQPSPGEFIDLYNQAFAEGCETIISLHISAALSGTCQSARQAAEELAGKDIRVVDSRSISVGMGVQVRAAAEAIAQGLPVEQVLQAIETCRQNHELLFTLDTLEYLAKGGRIGKAKSLLGSLLNIKPIIRVVDGAYVDAGKARSQKQALTQIAGLFAELSKGRRIKRLAIGVGAADEAGQALKAELKKAFGLEPSLSYVTPVIGVHTGPGTVGAAVEYYPS